MDMDLFDQPLSLLGPSSLDLFDPFDEIDRRLSRNVSWLSQPSLLPALDVSPLVPEKHRITVNCPGISEDNIKTEVKSLYFNIYRLKLYNNYLYYFIIFR